MTKNEFIYQSFSHLQFVNFAGKSLANDFILFLSFQMLHQVFIFFIIIHIQQSS
jgi:hypothetical protein